MLQSLKQSRDDYDRLFFKKKKNDVNNVLGRLVAPQKLISGGHYSNLIIWTGRQSFNDHQVIGTIIQYSLLDFIYLLVNISSF